LTLCPTPREGLTTTTISPKFATLALTALATFATTLGMAATAHADAPVNLTVTDAVRAREAPPHLMSLASEGLAAGPGGSR
jgi:hypothetical protein